LVRPCLGSYSAGLIIPDGISGGRGFDRPLGFESPAPGTHEECRVYYLGPKGTASKMRMLTRRLVSESGGDRNLMRRLRQESN
jgi:hypothetical protein